MSVRTRLVALLCLLLPAVLAASDEASKSAQEASVADGVRAEHMKRLQADIKDMHEWFCQPHERHQLLPCQAWALRQVAAESGSDVKGAIGRVFESHPKEAVNAQMDAMHKAWCGTKEGHDTVVCIKWRSDIEKVRKDVKAEADNWKPEL